MLAALPACAAAQPLDAAQARATVLAAWQANQHAVWELNWPNSPVAGPVTVEAWRAGGCARGGCARYEILEAEAPALVGQTLVMTGPQSWQFNRLEAAETTPATYPELAPVTPAISLINRLLANTPVAATLERARVEAVWADKINLQFKTGDRLVFFVEAATGLPVQIEFTAGEQTGRIRARSVELLPQPPPELFRPAP